MKIYTKFIFLICIVSIIVCMPNCKKGEKDPFFSFKSRTKRLVGEWKAKDYILNESITYNYSNSTEPYKVLLKYEDDNLTLSDTYFHCTGTIKENAINFYENGNWESVFEYNIAYCTYEDFHTIVIVKSSGSWSFEDSFEEFKNAECIKLEILSETSINKSSYMGMELIDSVNYTWKSGVNFKIWHLIKLAKDEIECELATDYKLALTENDYTKTLETKKTQFWSIWSKKD